MMIDQLGDWIGILIRMNNCKLYNKPTFYVHSIIFQHGNWVVNLLVMLNPYHDDLQIQQFVVSIRFVVDIENLVQQHLALPKGKIQLESW